MRRVTLLAVLSLAGAGCRGRRAPKGGADAGRVAMIAPSTPDAGPPKPLERHVTKQEPLPPQGNFSQIFIGYEGSKAPWNPPRARKRSKKEALALASKLAEEARHGADFDALARRESDWPLAQRNGALGLITQGTSGMLPVAGDDAFKLRPGEVADPHESPYGYHVLKRLPMLHLAHIFIAVHDGRDGWPVRTRADAKALADRIVAEIRGGKSFADEAFEWSDDLISAGRGGDLGGRDGRTPMSPPVKQAVGTLAVGQVSPPVETAAGFEILERLE